MAEQTGQIPGRHRRIHFITGRLAESALRAVLAELAPKVPFHYTVQVMPITVAALMTTRWVAARLDVPPETDLVLLPGYCQGELDAVQAKAKTRVERGPRDLRDLPEYFGQSTAPSGYGHFEIRILAEINHAPQLTLQEVLAWAEHYRASGADLIDLGCDPDGPWAKVGDYVRALRDAGYRVSIDSMDPREIAPAVEAGAELVLSVNSSNRHAAPDWGCEVVVIPDRLDQWQQMGGDDRVSGCTQCPCSAGPDSGTDRMRHCREPAALCPNAPAIPGHSHADGHR
ncbi:MAG: hypothetical protein KatS3mg110_0083 [Pirellulaceae bacterium]|nr:MAG: hypothetical protein KatS3mg110_0083 [Pirellulaceae bacterium]